MEYFVVTDTDLEAFQAEVNARLKDGWTVHGNLVVVHNANVRGYRYWQTLTRVLPDQRNNRNS